MEPDPGWQERDLELQRFLLRLPHYRDFLEPSQSGKERVLQWDFICY